MNIPLRLIILSLFFLAVIIACKFLIIKKPSWMVAFTALQFLAGLSIAFMAIYAFFFYRWGLPAGDALEDKDWLSFLSGYLSFAGSLIMAWLVFKQSEDINRQSKIINQLTMQEYSILLEGIIDELDFIVYTVEKQYHWTMCHNGQHYFKYDLSEAPEKLSVEGANSKFILYFKLYNKSKLAINKLKFNTVSIKSFDSDNAGSDKTYFIYKSKDAGTFNGTHSIGPNDWIPICFVLPSINDFPSAQSCGFEVLFTAEEVKSGDTFNFVLYYNDNGKKLTFVDGKEPHSKTGGVGDT